MYWVHAAALARCFLPAYLCIVWSVAAFSPCRTKRVALWTQPCRFPPEKVKLNSYIGNRKVVLLGLPGAFTPT